MVQYFTEARLENKRLSKETKESRYKDLEQAQKIFINSAYGFLAAPGLNFNSPDHAGMVTRRGREILSLGLEWAEQLGFTAINADTDSFCYIGSKDFVEELRSLNLMFPKGIKWENDGSYDKVLIVGGKNYVLKTEDKTIFKGSGLKATMKEPMLTRFIKDTALKLIEGDIDGIISDYDRLACSISGISTKDDIREWSSKKTLTKAVLAPSRTNEARIAEAIKGKGLNEGDKFFVFFDTETSLKIVEDFDGTYDKDTLYEKLYKSIKIFDTVLDINKFLNYSLKRNRSRIPSSTGVFQGAVEVETRAV